MDDELKAEIEEQIAALDARAELIALEQSGPESLRIYVDHPDGVDLGLCERVSQRLGHLSEMWALEVSSPGLDRPLTKPAHFQRFIGATVKIKTHDALDGRKTFTGRLDAADEQTATVADESGVYEIPLAAVRRANLVPEFSEVSP